jgi:hypothetical protein
VVKKVLIRNFNLIDIKKYEDNMGVNLLTYFETLSINNIIELIRLGNSNCNYDTASMILDNYLINNTLLDAMLEIKEKLIGVGDNNTTEIDEEDKIDITKFNSLTELYTHFCMQLMSVGLGYSEFWAMNTKEMYSAFNSIIIKLQNETNRELSNYHTLAAMVGGAVWGKLQKEPPKVNIKQNNGDVDEDVAIINAKLKSLVKSHNKYVEQKGE